MSSEPDPQEAPEKQPPVRSEFEKAGEGEPLSLFEEFALFIVENKAWWLVPIIVILGLLGLFVLLGSTGAAPFIYTLF